MPLWASDRSQEAQGPSRWLCLPEPLSPRREPPKPSLRPGLPGLLSSRSQPPPLPGGAPHRVGHPPAPERPLTVTLSVE